MAFNVVKTSLERVLEKSLPDLVRGIRAHKDKDEANYIRECLEEIKQELKCGNFRTKSNAANKLTYLQMLGYDISWAAFNIVEIMSSSKFHVKRVGYLAASQSFSERTDVLMLTTNLIRKDLNSGKMYDTSIALSGLSCFMTADLAKDLCADITSLTSSSQPYIRKKAILLLYKVFLKYPEALQSSFPRLRDKLEDPDPGTQSAAVNVICELARKNPQNYLSLSPLFFKLMTTSTNNWVLIKIIKLFGALTPLEPRLGKKLIEPLTNLIHSTSAMSLLYECINTVLAGVPNHEASIQLCVQKLRMLIEDSDQNLKYLGLLAMNKIFKHHPKSVQVHKNLIIACLEDKDESIRLRALDLMHGMVSKKNLTEIVKSLIVNLKSSIAVGAHYRSELVSKIVEICSQDNYHFILSFEWYISVLVELSQLNEGKNGEMLANQLLDVAVRVATVRSFAVAQMAILMAQYVDTPPTISNRTNMFDVIYAAAWICGEFGRFLEDPHETVKTMLKIATISCLGGHIKSMLILNVLKLYSKMISQWLDDMLASHKQDSESVQLPLHDLSTILNRISDLTNFLIDKLTLFVHSSDLEVQERAVSIHQLLCLVAKRLSKLRSLSQQPVVSTHHSDTVYSNVQLIDVEPLDPMLLIKDQPKTTKSNETNSSFSPQLVGLQALINELGQLFYGELNPVATKAQRKVPILKGLDLDQWINEPPSHDSSIHVSNSQLKMPQSVGGLSPECAETTKTNQFVQLTELEKQELKRQRLELQKANPHYLKETKPTDANKVAMVGPTTTTTTSNDVVDSIHVNEALSRSLRNASGKLASSDEFALKLKKQFIEKKRTNKSSKRQKDVESLSLDEDDNLQASEITVSALIDLPEGVGLADLDSPEELDPNDPHSLLNIKLEIPMETESYKKSVKNEKKRHSKKNVENGINSINLNLEAYQILENDVKTTRVNRKTRKPKSSTISNTESSSNVVKTVDDVNSWLYEDMSSTKLKNMPTISPAPEISELDFMELLAVGNTASLNESVKVKVRCPALGSVLSNHGDAEKVFLRLLDKLKYEAKLSVVERVHLTASLFVEINGNPICLLLKGSLTTGSVTIEVKARKRSEVEEFTLRAKNIVKSFKH